MKKFKVQKNGTNEEFTYSPPLVSDEDTENIIFLSKNCSLYKEFGVFLREGGLLNLESGVIQLNSKLKSLEQFMLNSVLNDQLNLGDFTITRIN